MRVNQRQHDISLQQWSAFRLITYIFCLRLFNAVTIKTFFQPDEFYQSIEPAHNFVFGYGYLTWEWTEGLRSSLLPLIYSIGYWLAKCVRYCEFLDSQNRDQMEYFIVLYSPKIIGAIIATIGEFYLYKFIAKITKDELSARIGLGLSLINGFNWFIITRSFSNSFEMVLITVALYHWPWNSNDNSELISSLLKSCVFGGLSCIIRPSNGLIWGFLGVGLLTKYPFHVNIRIIWIIFNELVLLLVVNIAIDYYFYGKFVLPWYNFYEFNIVKSLSIFYGSNPWHFYIFQGLPLILLTNIPLTSLYIYRNWKKQLSMCVIFNVIILSLIQHKEIRFLYPLQPLFILFSAITFTKYFKSLNFNTVRMIIGAMILINVTISYFLTQMNERGVIDIIEYLHDDRAVTSFGFLTPCHSTPWQSHLHRPDLNQSWFITCEPPLHLNNIVDIKQYKDESDLLFEDPFRFLNENFPPLIDIDSTSYNRFWPSHLVVFEPLAEIVSQYLEDSPYEMCNRLYNSHFHWDDRRHGDLIVFCRD